MKKTAGQIANSVITKTSKDTEESNPFSDVIDGLSLGGVIGGTVGAVQFAADNSFGSAKVDPQIRSLLRNVSKKALKGAGIGAGIGLGVMGLRKLLDNPKGPMKKTAGQIADSILKGLSQPEATGGDYLDALLSSAEKRAGMDYLEEPMGPAAPAESESAPASVPAPYADPNQAEEKRRQELHEQQMQFADDKHQLELQQMQMGMSHDDQSNQLKQDQASQKAEQQNSASMQQQAQDQELKQQQMQQQVQQQASYSQNIGAMGGGAPKMAGAIAATVLRKIQGKEKKKPEGRKRPLIGQKLLRHVPNMAAASLGGVGVAAAGAKKALRAIDAKKKSKAAKQEKKLTKEAVSPEMAMRALTNASEKLVAAKAPYTDALKLFGKYIRTNARSQGATRKEMPAFVKQLRELFPPSAL